MNNVVSFGVANMRKDIPPEAILREALEECGDWDSVIVIGNNKDRQELYFWMNETNKGTNLYFLEKFKEWLLAL